MGKKRTAKRFLCIVGLTAVAVFVGKLWYWRHNPLLFLGDILPSGKIEGHITDMESGKPLKGIHVFASPWWCTNPRGGGTHTTTHADGSYALGGLLAPEDYQVEATTFLPYEPRGYESDWVEVQVFPFWRTRLDFAIDRTPPKLRQVQPISMESSAKARVLRVVASDNVAVSTIYVYRGIRSQMLCSQHFGTEFGEPGRNKENALEWFHPPARVVRYVGRHDDPWGQQEGRWGWLQVWSQPGAEFTGTTDTGHLLYQEVAGDFDVVTSLSARPRRTGDESGLMVRQDANRWLKLVYTRRGWRNRVVCLQKEGAHVTGSAAIRYSADPLFLRITRKRGTFTTFISRDGQHWQQQHRWSKRLNERLLVGLMIGSASARAYRTDFDFLRFREITVARKLDLSLVANSRLGRVKIAVLDAMSNTVTREVATREATAR